MAKIRDYQTGFTAGQLDPDFKARSDVVRYKQGALQLQNISLSTAGGGGLRPGMRQRFRWASDVPSRMIGWQFSLTETYILILRAGQIDVHDGADGQYLTTVVAAELSQSVLWEVTYTQGYDTFIFAHQTFRPQVLKRTGAASFTWNDLAFSTDAPGNEVYQPFYKFPEAASLVLLPGSNDPGANTMTTGTVDADGVFSPVSGFWDASHIGQRFHVSGTQFTVTGNGTGLATVDVTVHASIPGGTKLWTYPLGDNSKWSVGEVIVGRKSAATGVIRRIADGATLDDHYFIVDNTSGTFESADGYQGTGLPDLNANEVIDAADTPGRQLTLNGKEENVVIYHSDWGEPAWSDSRGWPAAVSLSRSRLWFGGSSQLPTYLWGSQLYDYFNFSVGDGADNDALAAPVGSESVHRVIHITEGNTVEVLTDSGEFFISSYQGSPITPSNFVVRKASDYGAGSSRPIRFSSMTMFEQLFASAVRAFYWDEQLGNYATPNMTSFSRNVFDQLVEFAALPPTTARGEEKLFGVNESGLVSHLFSHGAERIMAWMPWKRGTGGWLSACSVADRVFFLALEDGGAVVLEELDEDYTLDGATILTAVNPQSVWTIPSEYINQTITVVGYHEQGDTPVYYIGEYTPTSSQLDLGAGNTFEKIQIGYAIEAIIEPMPIDPVAQDGPTRGLPRKVVSYVITLLDTYHLNIEDYDLWAITSDPTLEPVPYDTDYRLYQLGYDVRKMPVLKSSLGLPFEVLAINAEVEWS